MSSILRNYCEKNGREKEEMRDMAAERESMLIMKNVSKTFNPGTVNEKCALNGVNLTLGAGDFATIVGSNGAGKSTLFTAITGAFFPDRGRQPPGMHISAGSTRRIRKSSESSVRCLTWDWKTV